MCHAGTYRSDNNTCLPCEIGSFSKLGEDVCSECLQGETTLGEGADKCIGKKEHNTL